MKKVLLGVLAAGAIVPAFAQTSVGVSIGINQPGVYGRINIGDVPPPALVLPQPVLIAPPPVAVPRRPIYLYVPEVHQRDWRRYCGRYAACGQPVYFVRDSWVRERYEHEHPGWERGRHRGWDKHDKHDRDDDRGHGHGHGHGKHRD
jgi:hypothetical protein